MSDGPEMFVKFGNESADTRSVLILVLAAVFYIIAQILIGLQKENLNYATAYSYLSSLSVSFLFYVLYERSTGAHYFEDGSLKFLFAAAVFFSAITQLAMYNLQPSALLVTGIGAINTICLVIALYFYCRGSRSWKSFACYLASIVGLILSQQVLVRKPEPTLMVGTFVFSEALFLGSTYFINELK